MEVINKKPWWEITKGLNLPMSITSAAFTLRTQYVKYLYPQEAEKRGLSNPNKLQAAIDSNWREWAEPELWGSLLPTRLGPTACCVSPHPSCLCPPWAWPPASTAAPSPQPPRSRKSRMRPSPSQSPAAFQSPGHPAVAAQVAAAQAGVAAQAAALSGSGRNWSMGSLPRRNALLVMRKQR